MLTSCDTHGIELTISANYQ